MFRNRRRHVLVLIATLATALGLAEPASARLALPPIQLYASATGSGIACAATNPCSLTTARDMVRMLSPIQMTDIAVNLAGGTYRLAGTFQLGPQDSGGNGHTVTWQAAPGQSVTFSAGTPVTGFSQYDAQNNLWRAPLPASAPNARQLYVNGVRAVRARTPQTWPDNNSMWTPTAQGLATVSADTSYLTWPYQPGIEVVADSQWKHLRCPVVGIAKTTDTTPLTLPGKDPYPAPAAGGSTLVVDPTCWRQDTLAPPHPGFPLTGSGLPYLDHATWIENSLNLLGAPGAAPGQFYLDPAQHYLYYKPRPGENMATANVELPGDHAILAVNGTPGHLTPLDDTTSAARYTGTWRAEPTTTGDFHNTLHTTNNAGAAVSYSFTGSGVDVLGETGPDGGAVTAVLDGRRITAGTTTASTATAQQVIYSLSGLSVGQHTLTLTNGANAPLRVDGFVVSPQALQPVHDIAFAGITFAYSTWTLPNTVGYIDNQAGVLWDAKTGEPARIPGAVSVSRGQRIAFTGNTFTHLGGYGLDLGAGTQNSSAVGNVFTDLSGGGMSVGELDDYYLARPAMMTSGDTVANNVISGVGLDYHDTVGVWVGTARSVSVSHNLIQDGSYSGISLGWGWGWASSCELQAKGGQTPCHHGTTYSGGNQIVDNRINDVMRTLYDGGAIYTLGGQTGNGSAHSVLSGNAVSQASQCFHILYHDEGSSGWQTFGNLAVNNSCGHWMGIWMPTAHDNVIGGSLAQNHSDNPEQMDAGTNNVITPPAMVNPVALSAPAQAVLDAAGLEPAYRHLTPAQEPVLNNADAVFNYSASSGGQSWREYANRGDGDLDDDVQATQVNGASATLTFTGTGIALLGERNSDQGNAQVTVDGGSPVTVDTSASSRQAQQVIFSASGLAAGRHVLTITKLSGGWLTVDGARVTS